MITIERTAPLLTVQDRGRFGYLADGVTHSGPLDALALDVANGLAGNGPGAAVLEACQGGAAIRFATDTTFAIAGADVSATLGGLAVRAYESCTARAGDVLDVDRIVRGAVWYLAIRGGIDVPQVLGSRSTLLSAGFGGAEGKPVRTGQSLVSGKAVSPNATPRAVPSSLRARLDDAPIPLVPAPRGDALTSDDWDAFYSTTFVVSRAISRVGYRLEGAPLTSRLRADLASEPACRGAMQLPPEGLPIVLMADHPTIGGYPIIGVVAATAVGALAQRTPGSNVRFERCAPRDALEALLRERDTLSKWLSHG
jgi:biotin-dependent carboxylase-like uncharacterized protein